MKAPGDTGAGLSAEHGLLRHAGLWLLFLAPFFFLSYGFANWWTDRYAQPSEVVFSWESRIPFLPWTILPYWSIDLFYGFSFLAFKSRRGMDVHGRRLLTAQILAVACFLLFPLRFTFVRPPTSGLWGSLFEALAGFDKPFNQAPSLHIALLVLIWVPFARITPPRWRIAVHAWAALIGISVLTTFQHHFLDLPTGALAGLFVLWLWPEECPCSLAAWRLSRDPARLRLAAWYLTGSALLIFGMWWGGWTLWLTWPATALALVALSYVGLGAEAFQKCAGRLSVATSWLLAPYRLGAWINSRLWTWRHPEPTEIVEGVWLGRMPSAEDLRKGGFAAVLDLSAELQVPTGSWTIESLPWLDLLPPDPKDLREAAVTLERLRAQGPVLVCCALGYSRSASAVAAWLLHTGRALDLGSAVRRILEKRPRLALGRAHLSSLEASLELGAKREGRDA